MLTLFVGIIAFVAVLMLVGSLMRYVLFFIALGISLGLIFPMAADHPEWYIKWPLIALAGSLMLGGWSHGFSLSEEIEDRKREQRG